MKTLLELPPRQNNPVGDMFKWEGGLTSALNPYNAGLWFDGCNVKFGISQISSLKESKLEKTLEKSVILEIKEIADKYLAIITTKKVFFFDTASKNTTEAILPYEALDVLITRYNDVIYIYYLTGVFVAINLAGTVSTLTLNKNIPVEVVAEPTVLLAFKNHLLLFGSDPLYNTYMVAWSSLGDFSDWDFGSTTNSAGTLPLSDNPTVAVKGLRNQALVYYKEGLGSLRFSGGSFIFSYSGITEKGIGCLSKDAVFQLNNVHYVVDAQRNIWQTDGQSIKALDYSSVRDKIMSIPEKAFAELSIGYSNKLSAFMFSFPSVGYVLLFFPKTRAWSVILEKADKLISVGGVDYSTYRYSIFSLFAGEYYREFWLKTKHINFGYTHKWKRIQKLIVDTSKELFVQLLAVDQNSIKLFASTLTKGKFWVKDREVEALAIRFRGKRSKKATEISGVKIVGVITGNID